MITVINFIHEGDTVIVPFHNDQSNEIINYGFKNEFEYNSQRVPNDIGIWRKKTQ